MSLDPSLVEWDEAPSASGLDPSLVEWDEAPSASGLDPSLVEWDSDPSQEFQRSSVEELSAQLPRMETVVARAAPAPPQHPVMQREPFSIPLPPESEMPGIKNWAQASSPDQPPSISAPPAMSFGERFAQKVERAVRSPEEQILEERLALGMGDASEKAIAQNVPKETARRLGVTPFGEYAIPQVKSEDIEEHGFPKFVAAPTAAVYNTAAGLADFMTSAEGVMMLMGGGVSRAGTMAPALAKRLGSRLPTSPMMRSALNAARLGKGLERGVAGTFATDMAKHAPDTLIKITESIATGDAQGAAEGFLNAGMTVAAAKHALTRGGVTPDAIQRSPEKTVQPLQARAAEGEGKVPIAEGREQVSDRSQLPAQPEEIKASQVDDLTAKGVTPDVQTKKEEALRETVEAPTSEQLQAAKPGMTPGAMELAQKHFNDVAELQRQSAEAQKAAAAATRKARIERLGSGQAADSPASKAEQAAVAKAANYKEALEAVEALKKPAEPSREGLGIVPKGMGELQKIISDAIGAPKSSPPPIKTDVTTPLPDFQEAGAAKKIFSQPFAFERIPILGAFFGGTRRLHGHINDAISRYHGEIGVGKAISSALGNEYSWVDKALATPGAENARAIKAIAELNKDFAKLESKYDLKKEEVEAQDSMAGMLAERAERTYKSIADKRLAQDKDLGGLSRKEKLAQLKASLAPDIASGKITEADLGKMVDNAEANGRVMQPAFFNKIFPPETAEALNKAFPNTNSSLRQSAASVNNALKSLRLGFDLAVGFIQGQALAARYPAQWGKAWFHSIKAFGSKEHLPDLVRKNIEPVRELAQMGSSVGQLQEYMAGAGKGQIIERIPILGPTAKAFGRQFSTFLDVAKLEMWKAYRETVPKEEWMNVVQSLESVLQTARMESTGLGSKRALTERVLLLAPSYYRGGLNLIAAMAEKGTSGKIARQAMGAYAVGGAVLFYGIGKMLGMSDEDLQKRFNPARTDFMMWRYEKDGRATEVGLGGFYRSLMRLAGDTVKTSIENPGNWKYLSSDKNPIVRWYRGHAGPVVSTAWDMFTGKDYMGDDTDIPTAARRAITPLGVESIVGKKDEPAPSTAQKAGAIVGLSTFPETSSPAIKDMNRKVRTWMATSEDEKVQEAFKRREEEHSSTYGTLRKAIYTGDKKLFKTEVDKLLKTRSEKDIIKTLRQRANYPLTGSKEMERDFMDQLSPADEKTYDQAKDDQIGEYEKFLDLLDASGL